MPPLYRLIRNSFHNQVTISILDSSTPAKFPNHSSGLLHSPNMRVSQILVGALAAVPSFASPLVKREHINDFVILNYALTLEFLERKFYQECLEKFSQEDFHAAGFNGSFYHNLQEIYTDERIHVDFLVTAITGAKGTPVKEAQYKFPFTEDPASCITLASVLEGVGVSAYLGAAASILEKDYLTAAGSILTVEARHSSYIRASLDQVPFPAPFDTPLTFTQVFSLAAGFITAFAPGDIALPFKPFPTLALKCADTYYESGRSPIVFEGAAMKYKPAEGENRFAAFFSGLTPIIVPVKTVGDDFVVDVIPAGVKGQAYVTLVNDAAKSGDDNTVAGPAVIEVYACGKIPTTPAPKCA